MSDNWLKERKKDPYYRQAKAENYRSRAAYKLLQITNRFPVMREGDLVIDLGAAPGGWSQVAQKLAGTGGKVIAIDLQRIEPIGDVSILRGDITKEETFERLENEISKYTMNGQVDVVISDMSPNISGNYSVDHAKSIYLCECALDFCRRYLKRNGNFLFKVFDGDLMPDFAKILKKEFRSVRRHSPQASRKSSSEVYVICFGYHRR